MITRKLTVIPYNGSETELEVDRDGDLLIRQDGQTIIILKAMLDEFDEAMGEVRNS